MSLSFRPFLQHLHEMTLLSVSLSASLPKQATLPWLFLLHILLSLAIFDIVNYFRQSPRHWFWCPIMSRLLLKDRGLVGRKKIMFFGKDDGAGSGGINSTTLLDLHKLAIIMVRLETRQSSLWWSSGNRLRRHSRWLTAFISHCHCFHYNCWFCCGWWHSLLTSCPDSIWQSPPIWPIAGQSTRLCLLLICRKTVI